MKTTCPRCKSDATKLPAILGNHSVAYCQLCGWNIPTASTRIRTDILGGWLAGVVGLVLVLLAWRGPWGARGALLIGVAFLWLPASLALVGHYRLTQIKRIAIGLPRTTNSVAVGAQANNNFELDRFCLTPRPRRVRMSWRGRLYVVGVGGAAVLAIWLLSIMVQAFQHPPPGMVLKGVFAVLVYGWWCWCCFAFFRNRIRERNLFVNGESARGTVTTRTEGRQGAYLIYAFQDASGRTLQNRVFDFSNNQFEQMPLHVFYDGLDPSRSAALESSLYRFD